MPAALPALPARILSGALLVVLGLSGCTTAPTIRLPPAGGALDYQLGEAYAPPIGVNIVARDQTAEPAGVGYDICYLNGFQTQPGELSSWPAYLLLKDADGQSVFDPGWPDEALLDTTTASHRAEIAERIGVGIRGCAAKGFDAVEFDNLDSYTRSGGRIHFEDNSALAALLTTRAHDYGLAAAQKNTGEMSAQLREQVGFDFVVAEGCMAYTECALYSAVYRGAVIDIEYSDDLAASFASVCANVDAPASMVLRDRNLTAPSSAEYVYETCSAEHPNG